MVAEQRERIEQEQMHQKAREARDRIGRELKERVKIMRHREESADEENEAEDVQIISTAAEQPILEKTLMGELKRRRRRRHPRSEAGKLAVRYFDRGLEREVENAMEYQQYKQNHTAHSREVAQREQELLSRTVLVSNVKDLRIPHNLDLLGEFFKCKYGNLEMCSVATFFGKKKRWKHNGFQKARIRFQNVEDAQKIFRGKKLLHVRRDQDAPVVISDAFVGPHLVGDKGTLRVQPSQRYPDMEVDSDSCVWVTCYNLRIGHWRPSGSDAFEAEGHEEHEEFLIEDCSHSAVDVCINLDARMVQVQLQCSPYRISFRFKDLVGQMGVFLDESSSYAILFRLKHPPAIHHISHYVDRVGMEQESTSRCLEMGGITSETFGSCFGYMLQTSSQNIAALFRDKNQLQRMKRFGVLPRDQYTAHDARIVQTRTLDGGMSRARRSLDLIQDRSVGESA